MTTDHDQDKNGKEIERRWVVLGIDPDVLRHEAVAMEQGYFEGAHGSPFRIRLTHRPGMKNEQAYLTRKSGEGIERDELEKGIDPVIGRFIFNATPYRLSKLRRTIEFSGKMWELDQFSSFLNGLMLLECECATLAEAEALVLPPWIKEAVEVTDSVTNFHLAILNTQLADISYNRPVRDYLPMQRLPRVVLTGGPCSGKTTVLEAIKERLGDDVHCVPEVATILIGQVGLRPSSDAVGTARFQRTLGNVQKLFEAAAEQQAIDDGKKMVIFDRGLPDNAAYVPGGVPGFEKIFQMPIEQALRRYDRVLVLDVPPKEVYQQYAGNNAARSEGFEQAQELGRRIKEAWGAHPHFEIIQNQGGMEQKTAEVMNALRALI